MKMRKVNAKVMINFIWSKPIRYVLSDSFFLFFFSFLNSFQWNYIIKMMKSEKILGHLLTQWNLLCMRMIQLISSDTWCMYVCFLQNILFYLLIFLCYLLIFLFRFCFLVFLKFKKSHSYVPYESRGEHEFCIGVSVIVAHQLFDKMPQRVMPPLSYQLLDAFAEYNNNAGA